MKVLLVSGAVSNRLQDLFFKQGISFGFAVQKSFHLYLEGFRANHVDVEVLSLIPVANKKMPFHFKRFRSETEDGVLYRYIPFFKGAAFYQLYVFFSVFFRVFFWSIKHRKEGYVFYDVLIPSRCFGTVWGASLGRAKTVAMVTDMPGMKSGEKISLDKLSRLDKWHIKSIYRSSFFVFLTQHMDSVLNPFHHPSIVIEALISDRNSGEIPEKNATRDILYAGGIFESYGLGLLCEAFSQLKDSDLRLILFGDGPFVPEIKKYADKDSRIVYMGTAMNDVVLEAEKRAALLVNPRFTGADYTLYSFPSKNLEYMITGTPVVTTRLAGIPEDHAPYIFTFDEETKEGFAATLRRILDEPSYKLRAFGEAARQYVIQTKNPVVQVKKILEMISGETA